MKLKNIFSSVSLGVTLLESTGCYNEGTSNPDKPDKLLYVTDNHPDTGEKVVLSKTPFGRVPWDSESCFRLQVHIPNSPGRKNIELWYSDKWFCIKHGDYFEDHNNAREFINLRVPEEYSWDFFNKPKHNIRNQTE